MNVKSIWVILTKSEKFKLRTKPSSIRCDSWVGQFLWLVLVAKDFTTGVSLRPSVVHLKPANCGGGTAFGGFLLPIGTIRIERMLWFPGNIRFLLLLHHLWIFVFPVFSLTGDDGRRSRGGGRREWRWVFLLGFGFLWPLSSHYGLKSF